MRLLPIALCAFLLCGCAAPNQDAFAKCLTAKGAKMYGAWWCPHCQDQKQAFDDSWKYVTYVECSGPDYAPTRACIDAGIGEYPTWDFGNGSRKEGGLSLEELSAITGCGLNRS